MSFSSDIKDELIRNSEMSPCCTHAMAYGMLLFGRYFNENDISIMTDNSAVADKYASLIKQVCSVEANVAVSEAGKITVSVEDSKDRKSVLSVFSNSGNEKFMRIDRGNLLNESSAGELQDEIINCCNAAFLKGAFLSCGTCSDPNKSYHIEFVAPFRTLSFDLLKILTDYGLNAKHMLRRGINVIYIKDSASIEELLALIGAHSASMEIMNIKIYKDVRNLTNRRNNFETANFSRTCDAAYDQVEAIRKLRESGAYQNLSEDLKQIAEIRIENPEASLREIGELCTPPLSRSAVNYRLKRLMDSVEKKEE